MHFVSLAFCILLLLLLWLMFISSFAVPLNCWVLGFGCVFFFPKPQVFPFVSQVPFSSNQGGFRGVSVQPCAPSCWLGLNHNNFLLPFSSYLSSSHLFIIFSSFILLFCFFLYLPPLSYLCFPYSVASLYVFSFFFHSYQYIFTCLQHS